MSRYALVINPTSGKGAGSRIGGEFRARMRGKGHDVIDCTRATPHEAVQAARAALDKGVDALVVAGGDGTVNMGVNLVAESGTPLGIVACGTGNDIATNLGLPVRDAARAAEVISGGNERRIDLMRVRPEQPDPRAGGTAIETRYFAGALGAGFDAIVTARAGRMRWPRGNTRYTLAVLRELPVFKPIPFTITIDGREKRTDAMLVAAANATSFGGGMRICPQAEMDDGVMDLLVVSKISTREFLKVFPSVYKGAHLDHPAVEIVQARHVRLEAPNIISQADGEMFLHLPLTIEVLPGAMSVLTHGVANGGPETRLA